MDCLKCTVCGAKVENVLKLLSDHLLEHDKELGNLTDEETLELFDSID